MYKVYCDNVLIYDPRSEDLTLIEPKLTLEVNSAGSFTFKMPPTHPEYDLTEKMLSRVRVLQDDEEIFKGRITEEEIDFWNRKAITCEGELAFLNDSIQRPAEYHDMTVRGYLETLIDNHNSQVEEDKQFTVGIVTVEDTNDSLYRYTNYNNTMTEIKEDLVDDLGGYIKVRNVYDSDGNLTTRYLDYVNQDEYGNTNAQTVEFGENLIDFTRNLDVTEIATIIIPLGAVLDEDTENTIEGLNERLTIADVNDGLDYLVNEDAVALYGKIYKTVTWDNVTTAEALLSKGKAYLTDYQYDSMEIEAKAVDLHYTDEEFEAFRLGDMIRVVSKPHGIDKYFPLSKMTIWLNNVANNTITLNATEDKSISGAAASLSSSIDTVEKKTPSQSKILQAAKDNATALITAATHGYVVTTANEILIMDTDDVDTATKVWRWNLNGLGYSSTGYNGTFGTAITMDGAIVADYITAGTLSGDIIKAGTITAAKLDQSMVISAGTITFNSNSLIVNSDNFTLDSSGNATFSGTLSSPSGKIGGWTIGSSAIYNGTTSTSSTTVGTYIGTSGIRQYASSSAYVNIISGVITAVGANINGTITASSGTIGGMTISGNAIYSGTSSMTSTTAGIYLGTGGFRQYSSSSAYVNIASGKITAVGADISGKLTATSGTIAGWTLSSSGFYSGTTSITSTTAGVFVGKTGFRIYGSSTASITMNSSGELTIVCKTSYTADSAVQMDFNNGIVMYQVGTSVMTSSCGGLWLAPSAIGMWYVNDDAWLQIYSESRVLEMYQSATIYVEGAIYGTTVSQTSDRSMKNSIEDIPDRYINLLDNMEPVRFKYNASGGDNYHLGYIANDVVDMASSLDFADDDLGMCPQDIKGHLSLGYTELVPLLHLKIKDLEERIQKLECA